MKTRMRRRRPTRSRPAIESLEARQLLSGAGAIDRSFGNGGLVLLPVAPSGISTATPSSVYTASALESDGNKFNKYYIQSVTVTKLDK